MSTISRTDYQGYDIEVTADTGRFTPRVTRAGAMIEHDGRSSEIWAAASCGSVERAISNAKDAIDSGKIK